MTMRIPVITTALTAAIKTRNAKLFGDPSTEISAVHDLLVALTAPAEAALAETNGRASAFCVTSASELRTFAASAEAEMARSGIPLALRGGAIVRARHAGPSAKAYKWPAKATIVTLTRDSKGQWFLTSIAATTVYPKGAAVFGIDISPAARDAVIKHAMAGFTVGGVGA